MGPAKYNPQHGVLMRTSKGNVGFSSSGCERDMHAAFGVPRDAAETPGPGQYVDRAQQPSRHTPVAALM